MDFTFKPAVRQGIHLLIGLAGNTGSGKTYTALRLATGLAGGEKFGVIDTEASRALHYADEFDFQHGDLSEPFSPDRYLEAIVAAEKAGFPVVVVDSMSHEHAGDGGILDMHDAILEDRVQRAMNRQNESRPEWKIRESLSWSAWSKPKQQHKRMLSKLLQLRCHLILCFRTEQRTKMAKGKDGKSEIVGFDATICAKGLEYEATASWMLGNEHPGQASTALKLPAKLRPIFPPDKLIDEKAGEQLAKWAAGSVGDSEWVDAAVAYATKNGTIEALLTHFGPPDEWEPGLKPSVKKWLKNAKPKGASE